MQITDWFGELKAARGRESSLTHEERLRRKLDEAKVNDTATDRIYGENESQTWEERRERVDNLTEQSAPRQYRVKLVTEENIHRPSVFKVCNFTIMVY